MYKKIVCLLVTLLMMIPTSIFADDSDVCEIVLNSTQESGGTYTNSATINGEEVKEYDYTWNADPSTAHDDVKNSPAEYYTGEKPSGEEDVYIAHDIYYYPELDTSKFTKVNYDGETEWVYYYDIEEYQDYIFSTLPVEGNSVPTRMMHSASEAYNNAVLHITKAGTYKLTGTWHGQIFIDLGEDSFDDPSQVVTLILDNVNIECSVASGICFYQVYEVDNTWEDRDSALTSVDTTGAGANVIIADDSVNSVSGTNIYRILKTKYKDENSTDVVKTQKKSKKIDGAFYSFMSMNIDGEDKENGVLNINSEFEGLDCELHLTINGGNINITADNDGINVNEDDVSIFTMNAGTLQILAGTGYEGDGIDSNGYININGGTVISSAKPQADSGLDSDKGTYINGGTVIATGSSMDVVSEYSEDSNQVTVNLIFSSQQSLTNPIIIANDKNKGVFAFDLSLNDFYKDANRTYQCLIISNEDLTVGSDYYFYSGGSIKGEESNGIYQTVKKYSDVVGLSYSSTTYNFGFGGNTNMPGNFQNFNNENPPEEAGEMPEGFDPSTMQGEAPEGFDPSTMQGEMPEGFDKENMPEGFDPSTMQGEPPEGFDPSEMDNTEKPDMPDNIDPSQTQERPSKPDGQGGQMFIGEQSEESDVKNITFTIEDKVNTYSGIKTYEIENSNNTLYIAIGVCALVVIIGVTGSVLYINKKKKEGN